MKSMLDAVRAREQKAEARLSAAREKASQANEEAAAAARELALLRAERALAEARLAKSLRAAPVQRRRRPWLAFTGAASAAIALGCAIAWEWSPLNIHVCSTSMTAAIADAAVRDYGDGRNILPYHFTVTEGGSSACDVRFFTAAHGYKSHTIAHDALVAIVNPSNPVSTIDPAKLRSIFAGHLADWSALGGRDAPIAAVLPPDGTDEALETAAFIGKPADTSVTRTMTAADIVRYVNGPDGANAIGIVPYSQAGSAKMLTLAGSPAPDAGSIETEQYPLSVRVVVGSDFQKPTVPVAAFLQFALQSREPESGP